MTTLTVSEWMNQPRAEVSIQCFNSSYFIQSTLNKSRSWAYGEIERESRLRVIVLEHEGVGGGGGAVLVFSHC